MAKMSLKEDRVSRIFRAFQKSPTDPIAYDAYIDCLRFQGRLEELDYVRERYMRNHSTDDLLNALREMLRTLDHPTYPYSNLYKRPFTRRSHLTGEDPDELRLTAKIDPVPTPPPYAPDVWVYLLKDKARLVKGTEHTDVPFKGPGDVKHVLELVQGMLTDPS